MKNQKIILKYSIICCISLWIWFYLWYITKSLTSTNTENSTITKSTESNFDKQVQCSNIYSTVKDKLTEEYTLWWEEENNWRLGNVEVRYSPVLDSCVAQFNWRDNIYLYTENGEPHYNPTKTNMLVDVNNWYTILAECVFPRDDGYKCDGDFRSKVASYRS